jgi:hypothetical protein
MSAAARPNHFCWSDLAMRAGAIWLFCLCAADLYAQPSFQFLKLPVSARMAAMGGVNVSLADRDINFFFSNPGLSGDTMAGVASVGYQFLFGGAGQGAASYAHRFNKLGTLTFGVRHINYGTVTAYDDAGFETGDFSAGESALVVGKAHQVGNYRIGGSFKTIFSTIAGYGAAAVAIDLGAVFIHPREDFTVGIVLANMGLVLSDFVEERRSRLPFDVQAGATFKPQHMPVRFSLTAFNLTDDVLISERNGEQAPDVFEEIFSHLNFGGEILLHRNFNILVGYNYLNHRLLKLESGGGGAGLSAGLSAAIRDFEFAVSRVGYVAGKASYNFTLSTNINRHFKKR